MIASNAAIVWRRESDGRLILGNYLVLTEAEESAFREFFRAEES